MQQQQHDISSSNNPLTSAKKNTPVKYALVFCKTEKTKHQYRKRLKWFFDYIGIEGQDVEEQGRAFLKCP
ncbi:MAG TPA: hypothetical protein VE521_04895 [Nitrososphaera sp.]|jgi:hypothetical protein|nr:hypothetical protein [Nitrososphaera sp.]